MAHIAVAGVGYRGENLVRNFMRSVPLSPH